jgi:ribonuclease BN (tRNA processing enzyme)
MVNYFNTNQTYLATMRITFAGTGTPPIERLDDVKACASEAIQIQDDILLFDCGRHVTSQLLRAGIPSYKINYLFFTHIFHYDHTSDYPNLIYSRFNPRQSVKQLHVIGPKGTKKFTNDIIETFIDRRGPLLMNDIVVNDVDEGPVFKKEQWEIECVKTSHGPLYGHLSLAYKICAENKSIVIGGDITIPSEDLTSRINAYTYNEPLLKMATDCDLFIMDADIRHTTTEDLGWAAEKANAKMVVLTHMHLPGQSVNTREGGRVVQLEYDDFIGEMNRIYEGEVIIAEELKSITI